MHFSEQHQQQQQKNSMPNLHFFWRKFDAHFWRKFVAHFGANLMNILVDLPSHCDNYQQSK